MRAVRIVEYVDRHHNKCARRPSTSPPRPRERIGTFLTHSRMSRYPNGMPQSPSHRDWYKDAIFYEVPIRSFSDSNADGIGDLPGLTARLDYIQALGVDCIWLLPFYPSPLKDDGYDISDFRDIHPDYGTLRDFRAFLKAAHGRNIKVIADLVLNHTSDQHPWFQEARRSPTSPHRGTALLASVLQPPARSQLRKPQGPPRDPRRRLVLAQPGPRRVSLRCRSVPFRTRGNELREPARDAPVSQRASGPRRPPFSRRCAPRGSQPMARRRASVFRRRRRISHGVSLSAHAAPLHGAPPGGPDSHHRNPCADARYSGIDP